MKMSSEAAFAVHAVRSACRVVQQVREQMVTPALTKDDRSPVTVGDYAAQALVAYLLGETFPDGLLVAEEDARALREDEAWKTLDRVCHFLAEDIPGLAPQAAGDLIDRGAAEPGAQFWTLDPIDGTKGYLRGGHYAVCLALVCDGEVTLGVMGCPAMGPAGQTEGSGAVYLAERGSGAWSGPLDVAQSAAETAWQRIHVSQQSERRQARVLRSFESGHTDADKIDALAELWHIEAPPVRMDSQAKFAVLAGGKGDLLLRLISPSRPDYVEKIWDQAAGSIVVQEAGGRVTDLDGKPLDFTRGRTLAANRGVLASNGHLHDAALAALAELGA